MTVGFQNVREKETTVDDGSENKQQSARQAMLEPATEDALYQLFRQFFEQAERERRWNLWPTYPGNR
jgi:hypothetical protein